MKEIIVTCPIYASDLEKVKAFQDKKGMKRLADALRVCVEYSQSHGALV
jgi:hypothetical protein